MVVKVVGYGIFCGDDEFVVVLVSFDLFVELFFVVFILVKVGCVDKVVVGVVEVIEDFKGCVFGVFVQMVFLCFVKVYGVQVKWGDVDVG